MPCHGEIIEPKDHYVTYAWSMDVSQEALWSGGMDTAERRLFAEATARARKAAAKIDPDCPVVVTVGAIRKLPDAPPYCERWGVHVRVEFQRYVYDATKELDTEWERKKHHMKTNAEIDALHMLLWTLDEAAAYLDDAQRAAAIIPATAASISTIAAALNTLIEQCSTTVPPMINARVKALNALPFTFVEGPRDDTPRVSSHHE